jgi:hypothetical protein
MVGLVGVGGSYYFYTLSTKEREPILLEEPFRPLLVEAASIKDSPLRVVNADGSVLEKNISSIRFYFWNAGTEPIKKSDVLKPLQLSLSAPDIQIVDLRILSVSRPEIVAPKISIVQGEQNLMSVEFDILEKDDGFAVQVLYAGSRGAPLELAGTIEGVKKVQTKDDIESFHFYKSIFILFGLPFGGALIMAVFMFVLSPRAAKTLIPVFAFLADDIEKRSRQLRFFVMLGMIASLLIVPFAIYKEEKAKIEDQAIESMLGIVPVELRSDPSKETPLTDAADRER